MFCSTLPEKTEKSEAAPFFSRAIAHARPLKKHRIRTRNNVNVRVQGAKKPNIILAACSSLESAAFSTFLAASVRQPVLFVLLVMLLFCYLVLF